MIEKKVHLNEDILKGVSYRVKLEDVDESTAIRQFIKLGVMWYVVKLYKAGKITLGEAAELAGVSLRRMLDILIEHGVKGNVKMNQQVKTLEYAKSSCDVKLFAEEEVKAILKKTVLSCSHKMLKRGY